MGVPRDPVLHCANSTRGVGGNLLFRAIVAERIAALVPNASLGVTFRVEIDSMR